MTLFRLLLAGNLFVWGALFIRAHRRWRRDIAKANETSRVNSAIQALHLHSPPSTLPLHEHTHTHDASD